MITTDEERMHAIKMNGGDFYVTREEGRFASRQRA